MGQTPDASTPHLAERWCWESARRDDARVARRLDRKPWGDGVYRLEHGAWLEDCLPCLPAIGVMALLADVPGAAMPRERRPFVP